MVTAIYPGANAQTLADTVAAPIEQEVNGVENMLYMSSTCSSDGSYKLTVTFEVGTDLDEAQVLVQNRVAIAMPKLPRGSAAAGRHRQEAVDQHHAGRLAHLARRPLRRPVPEQLRHAARPGRAQPRRRASATCTVFGGGNYGMRVWLDPEKLKARNLTTEDVLAAIREQNVQVAAGQVGQPPVARPTQDFQYNVTTLRPAQRPGAVRRHHRQGRRQRDDAAPTARAASRLTRVKDVARVELGAQIYDQWCEIGGQPAADAGRLPAARRQRARRRRRRPRGDGGDRSRRSPRASTYIIPFDTTIFVEESIHEVYKTLFEAGVLVLIVILVFLQDWRAVLIPATTVPVTIIGAFAAMAALGFSVNMLTLFGLVLAIGIVVDDAIVIVENAAHHIEHDRLAAQGGHDQGDGRSDRPGHRHHAGADGRVPADGLPGRHHRAALPAVRPDDRRHGRHQRHQRRDAQAGPVRRLPAADQADARTSSTAASTASTTAASESTPRSSAGLVRQSRWSMLAVRRPDRRHRLVVHAAADRLPADRGPGLRHRRRAAARRRLAGADAGGRSTRSTRSSRNTPGVAAGSCSAACRCSTGRRLERGGDLRHVRRPGKSATASPD